MMQHTLTATALSIGIASTIGSLQGQSFAACKEAAADSFATVPGSSMFTLPGVATDFVLAAGGQIVERGDGTAHLSALVRRSSEIDRAFLIDVELNGLLLPGNAGYPPAGTLAHELLPQAYTPVGPVNPASFRFYTGGSGWLRGYGAYSGALVSLQLSAPLQLGVGASNRNVLAGMAASFTVQVLSQPSFLTLQPTDEARLYAATSNGIQQCLAHADREDAVSAGPVRAGLSLPGVGLDYVFIPAGDFTENSNGTATAHGTLRREDDFEDRWALTLTLGNRVDPGDGAYPPADAPVLGLLSTAYVAAGGTVDPDTFRFYSSASGTLVGEGSNAGGQIGLAAARSVQLGVGANQENRFFGLYAELAPSLISNPTGHAIALGGNGTLRTTVATQCVLPYPNQTPGLVMVSDNIADQPAMITGTNLAWIEQMTIGSRTITNGNPRNWTNGYLKVLSTSQVEVHIPQGMAPGNYTTRVFTRSIAGGFRQLVLNIPTAPKLRTPDDRLVGESQDIFASQGQLPFAGVGAIIYSFSNVPTPIPGIGNFGLGNAGADFTIASIALADPVTKLISYRVPTLPAWLHGAHVWFQAAFLDAATAAFPASLTDVWSTIYN